MAGKINQMIETIIEKRTNGDETLANTTKTKLILKGIDPDDYDENSPDDPETIEKLETLADDLDITL